MFLFGVIKEKWKRLSVTIKENPWASESVQCNVLSVSLWHCDVGVTVVPILLLSKLRLLEDVELSQHMAELCLVSKKKWVVGSRGQGDLGKAVSL